jgi:tRNA pseudouridine55 synthase
MEGVLIIDKPEGITSHDVVARCRRILKTKRVGHTGTLDPFATGVMVVLVGRATRLAQFLDKDTKEYLATVRLGFETDTGDRTGSSKFQVPGSKSVSIEDIENILPEFRGEIWQTPPMYSAKKVDGKKLYELARKGIEIERNPVKLTIHELQIAESGLKKNVNDSESETENLKLETWNLELKVLCSAGTYIRVLAEDVGKKLGTGAHLAELRRTKAGKFGIEKAVTLEELERLAAENKVSNALVSMNEAVSHLAEIDLSESDAAKIKNGVKLKRAAGEFKDNENLRLTENGDLLAIGFYNEAEKVVQPRIVLV